MRRRGLLQGRRVHDIVHGAECGKLFAASRAASHMGLDIEGMPCIELAVDERMKQNFGFFAVHSTVLEAIAGPRRVVVVSAVFHAARSMARARASRDITV